MPPLQLSPSTPASSWDIPLHPTPLFESPLAPSFLAPPSVKCFKINQLPSLPQLPPQCYILMLKRLKLCKRSENIQCTSWSVCVQGFYFLLDLKSRPGWENKIGRASLYLIAITGMLFLMYNLHSFLVNFHVIVTSLCIIFCFCSLIVHASYPNIVCARDVPSHFHETKPPSLPLPSPSTILCTPLGHRSCFHIINSLLSPQKYTTSMWLVHRQRDQMSASTLNFFLHISDISITDVFHILL